MPTNSYWNTREIKAREHILDTLTYSAEKELAKQYQRMEKKIQTDMELLYDEIQRKAGTDKATVSDLYRFNKYYDLERDLQYRLQKLNVKSSSVISKTLSKMYRENYSLIGQQIGLVTKVNPARVKEITDNIWVGGMNWSTRLWKNQTLLTQKVQDGLVDCLATGASHEKLVKTVMDTFGQGFNEASRLVRTELNYVQNQSTADKYVEAGVEEYIFLAEIDDRTSDICYELDGKKFRLDEAQVGVNYPPMHPHCRSTVIAVVNDEF